MKTNFSHLMLTLATTFTLTMAGITPSQAVTFKFNWTGNANYSAQGSFSYDENTAPITFSEDGTGLTNVLQSLNVSFFDPFQNLIASYNNVVNGISTSNFLNFSFNTSTKEIFDFIDIGGENVGDNYLRGIVNSDISLFRFSEFGEEIILDNNRGLLTVVKGVPEPSSILGILAISAVAITYQIKRRV